MKFQFGLLILGWLKRRKFHLHEPCGSMTSATGLTWIATGASMTTGFAGCVRRAPKFHKKMQTQLMLTNQLHITTGLNLQITCGTFWKNTQKLEKHFNNSKLIL